MKTIILILGLILSTNSFSEVIPRLNCVGSIYDSKVADSEEEKVLLEYRSGGAAFMNVYVGEIRDFSFLTVLNAANPVSDFKILPVTLIIGNFKTGETFKEKNVNLVPKAPASTAQIKLKNGMLVSLSCTRLLNQF